MTAAPVMEPRIVEGDPAMSQDVDFEKRVQQIQTGSRNPRKPTEYTRPEIDLSSADTTEDAVQLKQLLDQARRRVEQLEHELDRTRKRLDESEKTLERKDEEVQKLEEQLASKPVSTGVSEEELVALHAELQNERENMEQDRLSMEEQFRVLEMQMSRERAEIARERSELQRAKNEIKHFQNMAPDPSSGHVQVADANKIRRLREEMLGESQLPPIDRKAPEDDKKSSGLLKRFLGRRE